MLAADSRPYGIRLVAWEQGKRQKATRLRIAALLESVLVADCRFWLKIRWLATIRGFPGDSAEKHCGSSTRRAENKISLDCVKIAFVQTRVLGAEKLTASRRSA